MDLTPLPSGLPTIQVPRSQFGHYEREAAARIDHIIQTAYPGHPFHTTVSLMHMRAVINHPLLPEDMAIIVRLTDEDPDGRIYIRLCGELLERFGIPRGGLALADGFSVDEDQQAAALSDIK